MPYPASELRTGDALAVLRDLPPAWKFKLVLADPPYGIGKDGVAGDDRPFGEWVEWMAEWLDLALARLAPGGAIYCYGYAERLAHLAVRYPLDRQRWLVWAYRNKFAPGSRWWQRAHESILALWSSTRPAIRVDAIREPYSDAMRAMLASGRQVRIVSPLAVGRFRRHTGSTPAAVDRGGAAPRDVLDVPNLSSGGLDADQWFGCRQCGKMYPRGEIMAHADHDVFRHPTRKPLRLSARLIASLCAPGGDDRVLVPFAGSGSECVAAARLGVGYLGVEINPEYAAFARSWIAQVGGLPLDPIDSPGCAATPKLSGRAGSASLWPGSPSSSTSATPRAGVSPTPSPSLSAARSRSR